MQTNEMMTILEQLLPLLGWKFYDFGAGNTLIPQLSADAYYLNRLLFGLVSQDYKRFTFLQVVPSGETIASLAARIDSAIRDCKSTPEEAMLHIHIAA